MADKAFEKRVLQLIADQLELSLDEITLDASFINDLGVDSIDLTELILAFEDEFDIEIPDEEADQLATVGDAVAYLHSRS